MKLYFLIIIYAVISGCALVNPIIGYERAFGWHIDGYVGKPLSSIEAEIYSGHWHPKDIVKLNEQYTEHSFLLEYSPYSGKVECIWAAKVNTETGIIENWKYVSIPSECDWPYFYEGAF